MDNKMASNNESTRTLKMKINKPQNIDASMYEGENGSHEDEIKYDAEENHDGEDHDGEEEGGVPDIAIDEALPPPPELMKEGETAAEEINIHDEKIEGEDDLDASITSLTYNNEDNAEIYVHGMPMSSEKGENELHAPNNVEFKLVQDMPSSSESWSERVGVFNGSNDNVEALPESVLPQQLLLDQNEPADEGEKELEVIDTFIDEERVDDIDEAAIAVEAERQVGEEDEQDDEEAEEEKEVVEKEGDGNKEGEGSDEEEMMEEDVEEEGNEKVQEDAPEGEEDENEQQQQQQDILAMEAGKASAPDITPELVYWCKHPRWHPNEGFNHCSNSMDIPQVGVDDEKFQQMFFFDTLVECCRKFFNSVECEHADMCAALNVLGEVEGLAFERQADGELEDGELEDGELEDEGQPGDGTVEEAAEEEVVNEEEEGEEANDANEEEEEEEEDTSNESNKTSSSTEGQGVQIDETNELTNWEGFDEDMTHQNDIREPEQPLLSGEAHDLSEAQGKDDYEGDGFGTMKYKLLRGKGEGGKMPANPFTTLGSGALMAAILLVLSFCCLCYRRYRRRRYASKRPNRGNYAALGRDDFFNGTFSDDVSFKDSDDDVSIESYGSDDGGHQTNLEMGGFHELDANGGLTLEEING